MQKLFLTIAGISGALSVMIGAFGAHGLKAFLENGGRVETFETAVRYQFYHTLALFVLGVLMFYRQDKLLHYAGWSFVTGMIIFSGTLYLLCMTGQKWLGAVTPLGGLFLIAGWLFLTVSITKM